MDNLIFKPIPIGKEVEYFSEVKGHMDIIHQDYLSLLQEKKRNQDISSFAVKDRFLDRPAFANPFKLEEDKAYVERLMNQRISLLIHIGTYTLQKIIDYFTNSRKQIEASEGVPEKVVKDISHGFVEKLLNPMKYYVLANANGSEAMPFWVPFSYQEIPQTGLINKDKLQEILGIKRESVEKLDKPEWMGYDAKATPVD